MTLEKNETISTAWKLPRTGRNVVGERSASLPMNPSFYGFYRLGPILLVLSTFQFANASGEIPAGQENDEVSKTKPPLESTQPRKDSAKDSANDSFEELESPKTEKQIFLPGREKEVGIDASEDLEHLETTSGQDVEAEHDQQKQVTDSQAVKVDPLQRPYLTSPSNLPSPVRSEREALTEEKVEKLREELESLRENTRNHLDEIVLLRRKAADPENDPSTEMQFLEDKERVRTEAAEAVLRRLQIERQLSETL